MNIQTRQLKWEDLKCEITQCHDFQTKQLRDWKNTSGATRIYVRLKGASFVSKILWIENPNLDSPAFQASVMLEIHRLLQTKLKSLNQYLTVG